MLLVDSLQPEIKQTIFKVNLVHSKCKENQTQMRSGESDCKSLVFDLCDIKPGTWGNVRRQETLLFSLGA